MNALVRQNSAYPVHGDSLIGNFFDGDFLFPFSSKRILHSTVPAVNITESESRYTIELAVPGIDKKEIAIDVKDSLLSVSAEKKEDKTTGEGLKFRRKEFSYSKFKRSFVLPENGNEKSIQASCTDGILTIHVPKKETEKEKTRSIKIS